MSWQNSAKSTDYSVSEALTYHALALGAVPSVSSDDQVETRASMMARVNYGYKNRYLLNASIRRDGYSAFGQANPWATFPSIGLGWIVSEEQFLKSVNLINYLEIKVVIRHKREWGYRTLFCVIKTNHRDLYTETRGRSLHSTPQRCLMRILNGNKLHLLIWGSILIYSITG